MSYPIFVNDLFLKAVIHDSIIRIRFVDLLKSYLVKSKLDRWVIHESEDEGEIAAVAVILATTTNSNKTRETSYVDETMVAKKEII